MKPRRIAGLILLAACFFSEPLRAADTVRSKSPGSTVAAPGHSLENTIELLLSPAEADREQGEKLAARNAGAYRDAILADLKDPMKRADAAFQLQMLVSPWQRGIAAGTEHKGSMTLPRPRRPVVRPLDGPQHGAFRKALLDALRATAAAKSVERDYGVESICQALTEIGDSVTMSEVARLLGKTDDREVGWLILKSLCRRMGFHHPDVPLGRMCGALEFAEQRMEEGQNRDPQIWYIKERDTFLKQFHFRDGGIPDQEQLMRQALDRLDQRLLVPEFVQLGYDEGGSDVDKLEPLIRFGEPILPLLRERQAAEADLSKRGNYEVIAAAITGKTDPELMRQLLASDHRDCGLACQIVSAAGSRDWTEEIAQLQFRDGFDHKAASRTLAAVLRKEAITHLKRALKFDPDNYAAKYAIAELNKWPE